MRVSEPVLRSVDDWRRGQVYVPSRAEAIRRMVGLASKINKKLVSMTERGRYGFSSYCELGQVTSPHGPKQFGA